MNLPTIFAAMTGLDIAALSFLLSGWLVIGYLVEHPPESRPSVSVLMRHFRREWMRQFVTRVPRIFDASIVDSLRQGTSFFASACLIAIGGGIAVAGNPEQLQGLASGLVHISMPIAIARPPSDIKFAEIPNHAISMSAAKIEIGTESKTINAARTFIRKTRRTMMIRTKASISASVTVETAFVIKSAWS